MQNQLHLRKFLANMLSLCASASTKWLNTDQIWKMQAKQIQYSIYTVQFVQYRFVRIFVFLRNSIQPRKVIVVNYLKKTNSAKGEKTF